MITEEQKRLAAETIEFLRRRHEEERDKSTKRWTDLRTIKHAYADDPRYHVGGGHPSGIDPTKTVHVLCQADSVVPIVVFDVMQDDAYIFSSAVIPAAR